MAKQTSELGHAIRVARGWVETCHRVGICRDADGVYQLHKLDGERVLDILHLDPPWNVTLDEAAKTLDLMAA